MLAKLPAIVGKGVKKSTGEDPFDVEAEAAALAALLYVIYEDHLREAGQQAGILVGLVGFDMDAPGVQSYLKQRPGRISKGINEETDKQLRATLAEGINAGESIDELAARVEHVYGAASGYRAERIARTEARRTSTQGELEAWDQSEVVSGKEWFTAKDERVCPLCGPMNGKVVDLQSNYFDKGDEYEGSDGNKIKLDFEDTVGPPLHVSCRCDLLPVLIEA